MFSQDLVNQLAAELHQSEKSRVQVEHFSKRFPGMAIEDGYAISRDRKSTRLNSSHRP